MRACCVACNLGQLKLSLFHMHEYSSESYLVLDLHTCSQSMHVLVYVTAPVVSVQCVHHFAAAGLLLYLQ